MVAVLDCVRLLGAHIAQTSGSARLPYEIDKDKVGGISIKMGHEDWTKACKYMLTCCKYLLAHASHLDDTKPGR